MSTHDFLFISLVSFGLRLTGKASDTGILNVTIESIVNINFSVSNINFGGGNIDLGQSNATVDTLGNVINGNWTPVTQGFKIENIGTTNISLNLKTNKNASQFLGGTNPGYQYNITNAEAGSCSPGDVTLSQWHDVNNSGVGDKICSIFQFGQERNSIDVDLKLIIPFNAETGAHSDIFTATGTAIS